MKIDFTGKTAIVTGAGSGLNKCIALLFADLGANVYIGDIQKENAEETVKEIKAKGRKSAFYFTDISNYEQVKNLIASVIEEEGKIDFMINGAGMGTPYSILQQDPAEAKKLVEINVMGTGYCCELALRHMMERKEGRIVNLSSAAGRKGQLGVTYYAASKAAVINLTQGVACEAAPYNVNVNAICPGVIRTKMWEDMLKSRGTTPEECEAIWQEEISAMVPLGRAQSADDIAWGAAFLCSPYSANITGQTLNIDGGMNMN